MAREAKRESIEHDASLKELHETLETLNLAAETAPDNVKPRLKAEADRLQTLIRTRWPLTVMDAATWKNKVQEIYGESLRIADHAAYSHVRVRVVQPHRVAYRITKEGKRAGVHPMERGFVSAVTKPYDDGISLLVTRAFDIEGYDRGDNYVKDQLILEHRRDLLNYHRLKAEYDELLRRIRLRTGREPFLVEKIHAILLVFTQSLTPSQIALIIGVPREDVAVPLGKYAEYRWRFRQLSSNEAPQILGEAQFMARNYTKPSLWVDLILKKEIAASELKPLPHLGLWKPPKEARTLSDFLTPGEVEEVSRIPPEWILRERVSLEKEITPVKPVLPSPPPPAIPVTIPPEEAGYTMVWKNEQYLNKFFARMAKYYPYLQDPKHMDTPVEKLSFVRLPTVEELDMLETVPMNEAVPKEEV